VSVVLSVVSEPVGEEGSNASGRSATDERAETDERLDADERATGDEEEGRKADEVLDLVGQYDTRRLLAHARREPLSARELADRCGMSLSTVYRRTDALSERDLLDEQTQPDRDGNHYRTFEASVERISMIVEQGAFGVDVQYRRDLTDKFEAFWQDLAGGAAD
jgi:DNA-binding transcriptional ArsR family regulator